MKRHKLLLTGFAGVALLSVILPTIVDRVESHNRIKRNPSMAPSRAAGVSANGSSCPEAILPPLSASAQVHCDRWNMFLDPLQTFALEDANPEVAADQALANLLTLPPTRDNLEMAGACLEARMPVLADSHYTQHFYRFKNGPLCMRTGLDFISKMGRRSLINMFSQYRDLKQFRADSDSALIAAISFRESGVLSWVSSNRVLDTHLQGGLDFLGAYLPTIRARYLPPGYGARWDRGRHAPNESGQMSWAATLPQHDLPIAYGAWILFSKDHFEETAKKHGFSQCDLDALSVDARRFWTALFFAAPGGVEYGKPHGNTAAEIGGVTVLTHLQAILADRKAHGLEDQGLEEILSNSKLYEYTNVRLAFAVTANAAILEEHLGIANTPVPKKVRGTF